VALTRSSACPWPSRSAAALWLLLESWLSLYTFMCDQAWSGFMLLIEFWHLMQVVERSRYERGDASLERETGILKMVRQQSTCHACRKPVTCVLHALWLLQVDHPNCIKLFAIYETEKRVFIVTELVSGGELLDRYTLTEVFEHRLEFDEPAWLAKSVLRLINEAAALQGDGARQLLGAGRRQPDTPDH